MALAFEMLLDILFQWLQNKRIQRGLIALKLRLGVAGVSGLKPNYSTLRAAMRIGVGPGIQVSGAYIRAAQSSFLMTTQRIRFFFLQTPGAENKDSRKLAPFLPTQAWRVALSISLTHPSVNHLEASLGSFSAAPRGPVARLSAQAKPPCQRPEALSLCPKDFRIGIRLASGQSRTRAPPPPQHTHTPLPPKEGCSACFPPRAAVKKQGGGLSLSVPHSDRLRADWEPPRGLRAELRDQRTLPLHPTPVTGSKSPVLSGRP